MRKIQVYINLRPNMYTYTYILSPYKAEDKRGYRPRRGWHVIEVTADKSEAEERKWWIREAILNETVVSRGRVDMRSVQDCLLVKYLFFTVSKTDTSTSWAIRLCWRIKVVGYFKAWRVVSQTLLPCQTFDR